MENPAAWVQMTPEFSTALAVNRFLWLCPDYGSCEQLYGPFASHIHADVVRLCDHVFPAPTELPLSNPRRNSAHAFIDGNLMVVSKGVAGSDYAITLMHEADHSLFRVGQSLLSDNDEWIRVKRDVPIASAETYFRQLKAAKLGQGPELDPDVLALVEQGKRAMSAGPQRTAGHVTQMLRYFDDLGGQETPSSYACAAILVGIAQAFFPPDTWDEAQSYLDHLFVVDHAEAVELGRRRAKLKL